MSVGDALRELAAVVDTIEESGIEVIEAGPADRVEDAIAAEITVRLPTDERLATQGAPAARRDVSQPASDYGDADAEKTPTAPDEADPASETVHEGTQSTPGSAPADDGSRSAPSANDEGTASPADTGAGPSAEAEPVDGDDDEEDGIACTVEGCTKRFASTHGMRIHRSKAHDDSAPHQDPERLQAVYDDHDSFGAMQEALDVDVSVQTVRKQMIDHGIHVPNRTTQPSDREDAGAPTTDPEPSTADAEADSERDPDAEPDTEPDESAAAGDGDATSSERVSEPDAAPDDIVSNPALEAALPDGVTPIDLREAIEGATTLYEVQTHLGLEREPTRALLDELDLLELVVGRVADQPHREELKATLEERLRETAPPSESNAD